MIEKNKLISVIVPVYNVASYIRVCLDSICGQSYRNLEIILVDDGSTDASGRICDEYARRDSRIVVIHKQNGGLADARNAGLAAANGYYIGFVDSDDWIEESMYEKMYALCEEYHLDLIISCFVEEGGYCNSTRRKFTDKFILLDKESLLNYYILNNTQCFITNAVWDRLYKRTLLCGLNFPKGRNYEDICYTTKAFLSAEKAGYIDAGLYHYRIRDDSIMGKGLKNKEEFSDDIIADLLPQMKERAQILYDAQMEHLGNICYANYLVEVLKSIEKIYHIEKYAAQFSYLKKELYENKEWIRGHCGEIVDKRKRVILGLGNISIYLYILPLKIKKYILKRAREIRLIRTK